MRAKIRDCSLGMWGMVWRINWCSTWSPVYMKPTTRPAENTSVLGCRLPSISCSDWGIPWGHCFFRNSCPISGAQYSGVQSDIFVGSPGIRADPKSPIFNRNSPVSSFITNMFSAAGKKCRVTTIWCSHILNFLFRLLVLSIRSHILDPKSTLSSNSTHFILWFLFLMLRNFPWFVTQFQLKAIQFLFLLWNIFNKTWQLKKILLMRVWRVQDFCLSKC